MSKLENDCIDILRYSTSQWPRWISITELHRELGIPSSTLRNIFLVANNGIFIKCDNGMTSIHGDVFIRIATKYNYRYIIRKIRNECGHMTWHISCVRDSLSAD